jgi:hypothetical protein
MDFLSEANKLDPIKALQYRAFTTSRHRSRHKKLEAEQKFWANPKFTKWEASSNPSLIMVKGDYLHRNEIQTFTVDIIHMLREQKTPTLWALKTIHTTSPTAPSSIDVIKSLVCQAIQLNISLHTESSLALSCAQFRAAETPEQWIDLLARVIATIPQLYIIVDAETVGSVYSEGFSWLSQLYAMFERNKSRNWISRLKILVVSYGSMAAYQSDLVQFRDLIVFTRQPFKTSTLQARTSSFALGKRRQVGAARGSGFSGMTRSRV